MRITAEMDSAVTKNAGIWFCVLITGYALRLPDAVLVPRLQHEEKCDEGQD